jgi:hypothetical protein
LFRWKIGKIGGKKASKNEIKISIENEAHKHQKIKIAIKNSTFQKKKIEIKKFQRVDEALKNWKFKSNEILRNIPRLQPITEPAKQNNR